MSGSAQFDLFADTLRHPATDNPVDMPVQGHATERAEAADAGITVPDRNYVIPDGVIPQSDWSSTNRIQANIDAIDQLQAIAAGQTLDAAGCATLASYVGWGGIADLVDKRPAKSMRWLNHRDALKRRLDQAQINALSQSVTSAFYTPASLIDGIWQAALQLGFKGGRVLEPAAGVGHFIGRRPAHIGCEFTAVECEPVAAAIAGHLYPDAVIHAARFQDVMLASSAFDLAISNVPFGSYGIADTRYCNRRLPSLRIHDYYFVKALDVVAPGGLVAFVTATGTLDKADGRVRRYLATFGELLGAFRLPAGTFAATGNTQAMADVIFLRKRPAALTDAGDADWLDCVQVRSDQGFVARYNRYYDRHPAHVLGRRSFETGRFGAQLHVAAETHSADDDEAARYTPMLDALPRDVLEDRQAPEAPARETVDIGPRTGLSGVQIGAFVVRNDGGLGIIENDGSVSHAGLSKAAANRVALMLPVRDAAFEVMRVQVEDAPEVSLASAQHQLNTAYDRFVGRYGPIHRPVNRRAISCDPAVALLLSLEYYDDEHDTAEKAELFSQRTVGRPDPVTRCETPEDALAVSLSETGSVSPDFISDLLGQPWATTRTALRGKIYFNPEAQAWESASRYLSGNVVAKLDQARKAGALDDTYDDQIAALSSIQPAPLGPGEIDVSLGSPWVPTWVVARFCAELLGMGITTAGLASHQEPAHRRLPPGVRVSFTPVLGLWDVQINEYACDRSTFNRYGTPDFTPIKLIEHALNQKLATVWYYDSEGRRCKDHDATQEAIDRQRQIRDAFSEWVWEEPKRADELCAIYNARFNNRVVRQYDGSHLRFPGLSTSRELMPQQANFAWRVIEDGNALAAHVVGGGKTGSMVAAAMECKRLNLARKPLVVVPNNLLYQFAAEAIRFYPAAHVLVARKEDLSTKGRRRFLAKVGSRNWDLVIMTHESFGRVPMSDGYVESYMRREIAEFQDMIEQVEAEGGDRISVKRLSTAKLRLENQLEKLLDKDSKDHAGLYFEALGADLVLVDEAHEFKNLEIRSRMGSIPGVTNAASKRALDLYMKTRWIMECHGYQQRGLVMATGTPVSNSMTELYVMMRYLAPDLAYEHDIEHFDSWAAAFGEVVTALERAPEGKGYRVNQRFAKFVNVPELARLFRTFADVKMQDELALPVPETDHQHHVCQPSDALRDYMADLGTRAAKCRSGLVDRRDDNILKIASDGRHASLDIRLVDASAPAVPDNKVNAVVEAILTHHDSDGDNTQLVFCDLSVPRGNRFSVYTEVRAALMDHGIPERQIAFAQDYTSDAARERLYAAVRRGRIRVLLGSTARMGMGMNAQDRISDIHHVDAPWRPADVDQRNGRGVRQGNRHPRIRIHTYVTADSYDEFMWETLKRKAGFITQALVSPDKAMRRIEDRIEPKYAEIMALATGDPAIREKVEVDEQVDQLEARYRFHRNAQYRLRQRLSVIADELDMALDRKRRAERDVAARVRGPRSVVLADGQCLSDTQTIGARIKQIIAQHTWLDTGSGAWIGVVDGFDVHARVETRKSSRKGLRLSRQGALVQSVDCGLSAEGIQAGLDELMGQLDMAVDRTNRRIQTLEQERDGLQAQNGEAFSELHTLEQLRARQAELNRALADKAGQAESEPVITSDTVSISACPRARDVRRASTPMP